MEQAEKKLSPPYLSWKTFIGYIKSFDQGLPPRIDKSAMSRLSGANQNLVLNALIYLNLIKADGGEPQPALEQLVDSDSPATQADYRKHLASILKKGYPFLFDGTGNFDLERSTPAQFDEKFRQEGVSGETVQKCETFFISAAQDAGMQISRLILDAKKKGPKRASSSGSTKTKSTRADSKHRESPPPPAGDLTPPPPPAQDMPKWFEPFKPAFDKLPPFENPRWTKADKDAWINYVSAVLDLYIKTDEKGGK